MRAPLLRLLCFVPYLVLAGCDGSHPIAPTSPTTVEFVTVAPASVHLLPGGQVALSATPRNADRTPLDRPVTWASSDPALATVSSDGLVSAVAAGSVLITAESDGVAGQVVLSCGPRRGASGRRAARSAASTARCCSPFPRAR